MQLFDENLLIIMDCLESIEIAHFVEYNPSIFRNKVIIQLK